MRISIISISVVFSFLFFHNQRCNAQSQSIQLQLDIPSVLIEDEELIKTRGIEPIGRGVLISAEQNLEGKWNYDALTEASDYTWSLSFECEQASGLNIYFDNLHLNSGDLLEIVGNDPVSKPILISADRIGERGNFATPYITGQTLTVIFHTEEVRAEIPFSISEVGINYHLQNNSKGGGTCNVDVECSEAYTWQEQEDAVVRLLIMENGIQFSCSGALMNNTSGDQRRLVLSALHCMNESTVSDLNDAVVTFNYETANCGSGFAPENNFLVGITKLADSNDAVAGETNPTGSDFALVEIQNEIPLEWNPYWAGWNALNAASTSGVTVHHPSGGPKKISTYNSTTVSTFLGAPGSHWGVNWISTVNGHGVTEPGSSGCPLFNSNGLVMGALTGGFSNCVVDGNQGPDGTDYFGKLSYSWLNNPNLAEEQLKFWLDPMNTGTTVLEGSYNPETSISEANYPKIYKVFPNPADSDLFIEFENSFIGSISVKNVLGQSVLVSEVNGMDVSLNLRNVPSGSYFLVFSEKNMTPFVDSFIKK